MSTPIAEKLNSRGYWRVEIRPTEHSERRVASLKQLQGIVEKARVQLRGWDFPHIGAGWELPESQNWIGVGTDWSAHVEVWRAYLSGQFVYRGGIWTDWLDQQEFGRLNPKWSPKTGLPIVSSLWSITEFLEFAARLSQTDAGADNMYVGLSLHGVKGRMLFGDHSSRTWFENYGPARLEDFSFERVLSRASLLSSAAAVAIEAASELFGTFGYAAAPALLVELQSELLKKR